MNKKFLVWTCTAALSVGLLAGCSSGSSSEADPGSQPSANGGGAASGEPYVIQMVTEQSSQIPKEDNELELKIEEYTNTKLSVQWIPGAAYDDKINVMIASQDLPQIVTLKYSSNYISHIRDGLFWEVGPLIKDYPNLAEVNELHYDNIKVDGKVYGIPVFRALARSGMSFRQDWMEKLNLKTPVTTDDWYQVVKTMGEADPDGDGQKNSYGIMLDKSFTSGPSSLLNLFAVSQGAPNQWGLVDGQLTPSFLSDKYFEVLQLFRKLYAEGLINQDFPVVDDTSAENTWNSGKLGFKVGTATIAKGIQDSLQKTVPDAAVDVEALQGPEGKRTPAELGNNGLLAFPKSSVKTEEDLKQILTFLDKLLDEPMATLLTYGIEGAHWEKEGDLAAVTDIERARLEVKPYRDKLLTINPGGKSIPAKQSDLEVKALDIIADNINYAVANPAQSLFSETFVSKGAELDMLIFDAQVKFIMGEIDEAGWKQEIEGWRKAGGDDVIKEYTEQYQKEQ